jgi:hypothetical protein
MRFISLGIVVGSLLFASLAMAAEGKGGNDNGKGGPGPGSAPAGGGGGGGAGNSGQASSGGEQNSPEAGEEGGPDARTNPDIINPFAKAYKPWEVGAIFTTHRLVVQGDLAGGTTDPGSAGSGAAVNKFVNDFEAYARYDITKHDRVSVRAYLYERFIADSGESGVRFDDLVFTYTHSISLPRKFNLDIGLLLTAPTSYDSQLAGTVTTPRISVEVDRRFGPLSLDARTYFQYDIQTQSSYSGDNGEGGGPTTLYHIGLVADAELHMPFYEPLSVGAGLFTSWVKYHSIGGQLPSTDGGAAGQPIQQSYGGEAYLRYLMPTLAGFKPDITFAYAMGDPTVGYSSVLHDGVGHVYLGYRENSEFYLSLAVRY